jgi:hypothetical protein
MLTRRSWCLGILGRMETYRSDPAWGVGLIVLGVSVLALITLCFAAIGVITSLT